MDKGRILFYGYKSSYGEFSNMYPCKIEIDGKTWPSSEHYFQAMKFMYASADEKYAEYIEEIRMASTPYAAKRLGSSRSFKIDEKWDSIKDDVMKKVLVAKFTQNEGLANILKKSGDAILIENSPNDYYWGCGKSGKGKNMLGKLLMSVRSLLED